ncbi:MAG: TlpA disulfide reductase family protein [bacterium]|nr:TlpA disulfide reductase family protein [bacterium]
MATMAFADGPAVGEPAPDFSSLATSGRQFSLSENSGRPVLLSFWSPWCSFERQELSFLKAVNERYPDVLIAIVDAESGTPSIRSLTMISRSLEEWGIDARVIVDKGLEVTELYNITTLPTSMVIDPTGRIVHWQANYFKGADAEVNASLDRVYSVSMVKYTVN